MKGLLTSLVIILVVALSIRHVGAITDTAIAGEVVKDKGDMYYATAPANTITLLNAKGAPLVTIDTRTGKATLSGDPNEAARIFWRAVYLNYPQACVPRVAKEK